MKQYNVTGMSCAACSARVEKAVLAVDGVESCAVNLLTNSMGVEGTATDNQIIDAVVSAGYGASIKGNSSMKNSTVRDNQLEDKDTPLLVRRLIISLVFWLILMYFSMGRMMFGWSIPAFFIGNHVAMGLLQLLLTTIVMIVNQKFFINGFSSLVKGAPNMDALVALGSFAAFAYSVVILFAMTTSVVEGNTELTMQYMDDFYFESAATILTLITVGKMLEARSKGKTTDALKSLMKLAPKTANVIRNGEEINVPIEEVTIGDIFTVRPGENVPVDGVVIDGYSAVDESALTGESIPVDKGIGDKVSAATINKSGFIKCEAQRVGEDTTISQIIKMVSDSTATKAQISRIADKVSGIFVPAVIVIALVTFIIWMLCLRDFSFALARSIAVLVISCPCALGLATQVAIMVSSGVGAKNGILYKTAASIEEIAKVNTVILDKTGTITTGCPKVTDIVAENEDELLKYAGSIERQSEHPLASAIMEYVNSRAIKLHEVHDFEALPGNGVTGTVGDVRIYGGSKDYISSIIPLDNSASKAIDKLSQEGKTPLIFANSDKLLGIIAVADTIKDDSVAAIDQLKNMGIKTVMLTGDNEYTARAIGNIVGVDDIIAGVLPEGKEAAVRKYQAGGKVAMVGDGINDAPALVRADIGIAIGAGTDVAIDAAEIVLVKSRLSDVTAAIRLGRKTLKNIKENLFWAFIYNIVGIPLAAGIWYPLFGIKLNPMFGAAAMSLSSFCVVTNALRLNLYNIHDDSHDKKIKINRVKEKKQMEKKMSITGMMCGHCEARVKKVLEELPEVSEAIVSHTDGTAVVKLSGEIDNDTLKNVVVEQGYEVTGIE